MALPFFRVLVFQYVAFWDKVSVPPQPHTCQKYYGFVKKKKGFYLLIFGCARSSFREGNGTPLQYSCLENPIDGGAL